MLKTKIKNYLSWQRFLAFMGLAVLIVLSIASPLNAQAVIEGYDAEEAVQRGMIVQIKKGDKAKVDLATKDTAERMHGVVVNANDAPVTLSSENHKVFVATTGHYDLLVSNQEGVIAVGDYVTISSIAGIGMKAGDKDPFVIGRALAAFDGNQNAAGSSELTDTAGQKRQVSVGYVLVDIGVAKNPLLKNEDPKVPEFLRKAAEAVADKPVSATRIYLGILIFCVSTLVAISLLYGGVRSAIISVGRNPLSRKSIIRSMMQVVVTGLIVFTLGVFGVYLILRL